MSKEQKGKRRPDQDANEALTKLRESGEIPWDWIVDETRSLDDYSGYPAIKEGVLAILPGVRLDPWKGKVPLVLTESRSLAGVLRAIAARDRVRIASTNGQVGGFLHTVIAPLLQDGDVPPKVLYLGDYDLAGNQIESNTQSVLEQEADLDWKRIALTAEQVEQHDLPVIMKRDRRYKDERPHRAVETEALSQTLIIELLETELAALLPEPLERVHEREKCQRRPIEKKIMTR